MTAPFTEAQLEVLMNSADYYVNRDKQRLVAEGFAKLYPGRVRIAPGPKPAPVQAVRIEQPTLSVYEAEQMMGDADYPARPDKQERVREAFKRAYPG